MSYSSVVWIDDPFFIKRQRVQMACSFCRQRKIRCDGRSPCANCRKYSTTCNYVKIEKSNKGKAKYNNGENSSGRVNISYTRSPSHGKRPIDEVSSNSLSQSLPPALPIISSPVSISKSEPKLPSIEDRYSLIPNEETVNHLLGLYWVNVHPYVPVINKSIFLQQRENPNDPPSLLLLNAMFAVVAEFSDRPSIKNDPETHEKGGWIFFDRARNLLDTFLDAPRMSTIAALILMSIYLQHNTRRSGVSPGYFRRWMYIGMAIRMALELDLNKDCDDPNINRSHKELRKRLWWSLFMVDVLVCCGIGKASDIEEDECTIPEPDENDLIDEQELKINGALREFILQIKFSRMLHQLLRHNFSNKTSNISPYINQDNIIANFEEQIRDWFIFLQISRQSTEFIVENVNDYSTTMLHLHMLYNSFIILLHRRYILNPDSLSKCILAAQQVTPIGSLIISNYSSPFKGFLNCTTWCLLQAGMIHALNKVVGNESNSRIAEEHYEKIVQLFQKCSQITALQVLQDHANTCSSHQLSVMDVWSSPATSSSDNQEIYVLTNETSIPSSSLYTHPSLSSTADTADTTINEVENNLYNIPKYSNIIPFQNLSSYGGPTTTLHLPSATNSGGFEFTHLSPFPSPHNSTISPLCGTTPHESPNIDLGSSTHSPNEFVNLITFPVLGKPQNSNCAELLNNEENWFSNNNHSTQHDTWHQNKQFDASYTRFSAGVANVDLFCKHENTSHISSKQSTKSPLFYSGGFQIHVSPTTSPFDSPPQQEIDTGINSSPNNDTMPPNGKYSHSLTTSSNNHDTETCTTGYFAGNFSGLGICS
ncbi:11492_t:CDS:2 [Diversispora eburnea]|uniref:11492_t:CDS:1 n=1 Tax=Diversispora eburnea TaxID=1213867 RepID=A0A9N8YLV2_9GLOM|nr:11492_t:CDS:2 [Diversispora eburnea]